MSIEINGIDDEDMESGEEVEEVYHEPKKTGKLDININDSITIY